jgi:hypothetical protein
MSLYIWIGVLSFLLGVVVGAIIMVGIYRRFYAPSYDEDEYEHTMDHIGPYDPPEDGWNE